MCTNTHTIHHSRPRSPWWIFWRNPLLLKIVVWLGSLSFVCSADVVWADVKPVATFQPEPQSIVQFDSFSPFFTAEIKEINLEPDNYFRSIDPPQSPTQISPHPATVPKKTSKVSPVVAAASAALIPPRKIIRPQHTDLLTADNYLVGVNGTDLQPNTRQGAIEIPVPAPRQNTIRDRAKESIRLTKSRIVPSYIKYQATSQVRMQSNLNSPQSIDRDLVPPELGESAPKRVATEASSAKKARLTAGLKSNIVAPMRPRSARGKSQLEPPVRATLDAWGSIDKIAFQPSAPAPQSRTQPQPIETPPSKTPDFLPRLAFSQPKPIVSVAAGTTERSPENSVAPEMTWGSERLAKISNLQITDLSFKSNTLSTPDLPKQKIDLAPETQLTVGVQVFDVNDFTDTIDPLFDSNMKDPNNNDSMITRFGTRAGIYSLMAGSGAGIRHRFSPTLEGSVGVLARSINDSNNQPSKSGGLSNNKQNTKSDNSNNFNDNGLSSGGLSNSYGTIAQLTYNPSQDVKIGLTYVYGYSIYPEIGSDNANRTDGINSAIGLQAFARLNQNLALGGRIGFTKNSNFEFDKNIFTWSLTAALPDLGGKGNLAGIIIGQEPRVTSASDLNVIDSGSAIHVEGFYKIEISKDFSITPAIVYLTGPNIDNVAADAGSITGAIGVSYKF